MGSAQTTGHTDLQHLASIKCEIGFCGCGSCEATPLVKQLLDLFATGTFDYEDKIRELVGTTGACEIVLGALDAAGLIEHGTIIWGAWLTPKGTWARWALEKYGTGDLDPGLPRTECDEIRCWVIPEAPVA